MELQEFEDIQIDESLMDIDMIDRFKKDMSEAFKGLSRKASK